MSFFYLLKQNGFDWEKAKDIFYSLTEPQIFLINILAQKDSQDREDATNKASSKSGNRTGTEMYNKHFDLRQ